MNNHGTCSVISLAKPPKILFLEGYPKLTISATCVMERIDHCTYYFMEISGYNICRQVDYQMKAKHPLHLLACGLSLYLEYL